ncbi:MAG: hypothetical protein ISR96_00220 [Nitrospira sp.]|nr:hypothetical protein [Candidatus Brocadiales bacterium]MBL7047940.1 hypothetical protein [Nitrospira sp.]
MKKIAIIILFCLLTSKTAGGELIVSDEVIIAPNAVVIPLGKILLVRKDKKYCALKFTEFWTGKTEDDRYAKYESYYQPDGSGNFSAKNVKFVREQLSAPRPRGIGRFAFSFGNRNVRCGSIKLQWSGKTSVYFYKKGKKPDDYGIEIAPTIWTDALEVNVFDPRIQWYIYNEKRQKENIPIEKLWGN